MGHFSMTTFSTYTTLSTLFAWLGMWAGSAARQCVCDFEAVISHGLTTLIVSYKKHPCHNSMIGILSFVWKSAL